jgi:hypothetical protein
MMFQRILYHKEAAFAVFTILSFLVSAYFRSTGSKKSHRPTRESLQALLSVITPTQSGWSQVYSASAVGGRASKIIALSFQDLLKDICMGKVELRDPQHDLPEMIRCGVEAYGWRIRLDVDMIWWLKAFIYASRQLQVRFIFALSSCIQLALALASSLCE